MTPQEFIESKGFEIEKKLKGDKTVPASFMIKMMDEYAEYIKSEKIKELVNTKYNK